MSELIRSAKLEIPPLVIALTTEDESEAMDMVNITSTISENVGYKIPRWFDQSEPLRNICKESGRFTVLDSQLDDGISEMTIATRRLLGMRAFGRLLLPNAITMSPAKETVRGNWEQVNTKIISFAHQQEEPVMVMSHIDQTRMQPNDPLLHETEIKSGIDTGQTLQFDAIEMHVDTVLSESFPAPSTGDKLLEPPILASRIGLYNVEETPDQIIFNRIGRAYRQGITALYVGNSIMRRTGSSRLEYIHKILSIYEDVRNMDDEEFRQVYPKPGSNHPKLVDIY